MKLRPCTDSDLKLVFDWRNIPEVYQGFYTQKSPLKWEEHCKWWYSRPSSWQRFIIEVDGVPVGLMNIGQMEHWSPELGWLISPEYWNKGYATEAVKLTLKYLKELNYEWCHTTIKWDNPTSMKVAWKCGFQSACGAREGEMWLVRNLNTNY